jgi:hypothetical protein
VRALLFIATAVVAIFAAFFPASLSLAKPASPIQIDYCHITYNQGPNVVPSAAISLTKSSGPLEIKFVNEGDKVATMVRFGVTIGDETAGLRDVGTFSPGITIHHKFQDFSGRTRFIFAHEPQPKCSVQYIKFADGTTWSAGEE